MAKRRLKVTCRFEVPIPSKEELLAMDPERFREPGSAEAFIEKTKELRRRMGGKSTEVDLPHWPWEDEDGDE